MTMKEVGDKLNCVYQSFFKSRTTLSQGQMLLVDLTSPNTGCYHLRAHLNWYLSVTACSLASGSSSLARQGHHFTTKAMVKQHSAGLSN